MSKVKESEPESEIKNGRLIMQYYKMELSEKKTRQRVDKICNNLNSSNISKYIDELQDIRQKLRESGDTDNGFYMYVFGGRDGSAEINPVLKKT